MGDGLNNSIRSNQLPSFKDMKEQSMGETYKRLNILLRGKSAENFENIDELVCSDTPLPYFEDSLRLMVIDCLHLENLVVQTFLSQNDYHIKRTLRCKWFFRDKLSAESYMTRIFPYISVSLRYKLINKLSKHLESEAEAEKLFAFVMDNYSNKMAESLLPRCSADFIVKYFTKSHLLFKSDPNSRLLFNIAKRHPEVASQILSEVFSLEQVKDYKINGYKKPMFYLAGNHPDIFISLYTKYHLKMHYLHLGKKLTRKYGETLLKLFEKSSEMAKENLFREAYLGRRLSFRDRVSFSAAAVLSAGAKTSFYNWHNSGRIVSFMRETPERERLAFVEAVFKKVYNLDFKDYPKVWRGSILELLPIEQRQPFVETLEKMLNEGSFDMEFCERNAEELLCLYEFSVGFEKLKSLLSKASVVNVRVSIVVSMVKLCERHDLKALEQVVEYVANRHRHDDPKLVFGFLENIYSRFPTSALNLAVLEKLNALSYFYALKGHFSHYSRTLEKHILHCLKKNASVDALIGNFFDFAVLRSTNPRSYLLDHEQEFTKESKTLFFLTCTEIMRWIEEHPSEKEKADTLLRVVLQTYEEFNRHHKRHRIYLREIPGVEEQLRRKMKEIQEEVGGEDWSPEILEKYCSKVLDTSQRWRILSDLLKRNPDVIMKNVEKILNFLMSNYWREYKRFFASLRKTISFFEETERVVGVVLSEFKNGQSVSRQKTALEMYSHTCDAEEFGKVVEEYIPKVGIIEEGTDPKFSEIQLQVPRLIKNLRPRWKNLQLILKFFLGDFLQNTVPSFFSCCYHTRADAIVPFLREYLTQVPQRVSYKKNMIRLIAELCDRHEKTNFCLKVWAENKHYSLRRLALFYLSKHFLEHPTRESFEAMKSCILESSEQEIDARPSLESVAEEFLNDYVSALWRYSEGQKPENRRHFRTSILWFFNRENIGLLSQEFCEDILQNNLFKVPLQVEDFALHYMASDPNAVTARLQRILDVMRHSSSDPNVRISPELVSYFFSNLRENSLKEVTPWSEALSFLLAKWEGYPLEVLHEERLMCVYYDMYHRLVKKGGNVDSLSSELGKELKKHMLTFDHLSEMIVLLVECLEKFFRSLACAKAAIDEVSALRELVVDSKDRRLAVIAILTLSSDAVSLYHWKEPVGPTKVAKKRDVCELVDILESNGDEVVEIYLRRKFGLKKLRQK